MKLGRKEEKDFVDGGKNKAKHMHVENCKLFGKMIRIKMKNQWWELMGKIDDRLLEKIKEI